MYLFFHLSQLLRRTHGYSSENFGWKGHFPVFSLWGMESGFDLLMFT